MYSGVRSGGSFEPTVVGSAGLVSAKTLPTSYRPGRSNFGERPTQPPDSQLLFVVVTLVLVGLIVVYAATLHRGVNYLLFQALRAFVGFLALLVGMNLRHTFLVGRLRHLLLGFSVVLLVLTLAAGWALGAARRWLGDGSVSFQPAEFAKVALLLWLAAWFAKLKEDGIERNPAFSVAVPAAVTALIVGLTLAQPAVGSSFIMAGAGFSVFFVAGIRYRSLILMAALAAVVFLVAVTQLDYPRQRWEKFVRGDRYHQEQSLIAIGSGGVLGKGLGEGKQKYQFLPKMHNDFIFAVVGEEFGFLGSLVIFLLYGVLLLRGMRISRECPSYFGRYLAAGITMMLFMYAVVHVAVTLGLMPTTGQPLPFVSFGGSALVTNLLAVGILLNISRYCRRTAQIVEEHRKRRRVPMPAPVVGLGQSRPAMVLRRAGFVMSPLQRSR